MCFPSPRKWRKIPTRCDYFRPFRIGAANFSRDDNSRAEASSEIEGVIAAAAAAAAAASPVRGRRREKEKENKMAKKEEANHPATRH